MEEDEINLDDYELAEEDQEYSTDLNFLNIYMCYYKQRYFKSQSETMFTNIEYDKNDSTNKCMELLYDEMRKFDNSKMDDKDILYDPDSDIDIKEFDELYALYIDNEPIYMCRYLLPILKKLATMDWISIKWSIIPLKTEKMRKKV